MPYGGASPPVVALVTGRRSAWWWSVGLAGTVIVLIVLIAFSRVYLGVHWLSDVVGALVLGTLYLLAVECVSTGTTGDVRVGYAAVDEPDGRR